MFPSLISRAFLAHATFASSFTHPINAKSVILSTTTILSTSLPRPSKVITMSSSSHNAGLTDLGTGGGEKNTNEGSESSKVICSSWKDKITVSIQRSRKVKGGNFVQIATVDQETNEARCRTVVFRGFINDKEGGDSPTTMKMITDSRSSKVSEVGGEKKAELVWWFSKSSEQYRIRGELEFIGQDHTDLELTRARKEQWGNLSDLAREQFFWKEPGVPYNKEEQQQNDVVIPIGGRGKDGKVLPAPDTFLLMILYPERVDYLRLGDNYRQIDDLIKDGNKNNKWSTRRVNP